MVKVFYPHFICLLRIKFCTLKREAVLAFLVTIRLTQLEFLKKAQPMRFREIPHRLFSLYIAVQILKKYYLERTCFFLDSELQYSKLGRIFCFL